MGSDERESPEAAWLAALVDAVDGADALTVTEVMGRGKGARTTLHEIRDTVGIQRILTELELAVARDAGPPRADAAWLEFHREGKLLARLTLVSGRSLHWGDADPPGARLTDGSADRFCEWLVGHGCTGPREALLRMRRRERLWDSVVEAQAALLPPDASWILWEPGREEERVAELVRIAPGPLERASVCFRVLGASHPEWFVTLPLERLVEPYLHDSINAEVVAAAMERVWKEAPGPAGVSRWLVHAGGAARVGVLAEQLLPEALRWTLGHPVARNRTEAMEWLAASRAPKSTQLLHEVFADMIGVRELSGETRDLLGEFSDPETFYLEDNIVRGTSDRAYAALLLARRGETVIRERVLTLMDTADEADFHALALTMETLDS
ncbi:MAG: hypothetical protein ABIU54_11380 [Candidatus Eisenbacteria bacterium]